VRQGNYERGFDIDLTIKDRLLDFADLMPLEDRIDDLFLPFTVDVYQYSALNNADRPYQSDLRQQCEDREPERQN